MSAHRAGWFHWCGFLGALVMVAGLSGSGARAQIAVADYAEAAADLRGVFDFESFEVLPEPGMSIEGVILGATLAIAERFEGQEVTPLGADGPAFDHIDPIQPTVLRLVAGAPGENHAIAYHAGFGSNALFPLGQRGFDDIAGRGEGATAIRFLRDQSAVGFLVHADYADPLGARPAPGSITVHFFARDGAVLGTQVVPLAHGITPIAFRSAVKDIAGLLIVPFDPGGIAIDDILFDLTDLTG